MLSPQGINNSFDQQGGGFSGRNLYIHMEFCSGGDMAKCIKDQQKKGGPFEEKQVHNWTLRLCLALKVSCMNAVPFLFSLICYPVTYLSFILQQFVSDFPYKTSEPSHPKRRHVKGMVRFLLLTHIPHPILRQY